MKKFGTYALVAIGLVILATMWICSQGWSVEISIGSADLCGPHTHTSFVQDCLSVGHTDFLAIIADDSGFPALYQITDAANKAFPNTHFQVEVVVGCERTSLQVGDVYKGKIVIYRLCSPAPSPNQPTT